MRSIVHALPLLALLAVSEPHAAPASGFDRTDLDTTCAPCRDFYQYANGGWVGRTQIPPSQSRWGTFSILAERNQLVLWQILEKAAKDRTAKPGSDTRRIG